MRLNARRIIGPVMSYLIFCAVIGIFFAEMIFHPQRLPPFQNRQSFQARAGRFGAVLQDVSVTASDDVMLQGWLARPAPYNGNAVILLHGIGRNRQDSAAFAEFFLSHGYEVLLLDLRAQGTSGGAYPTYGVKETDDIQRWFRWLVTQQHPACVYGMGESVGAAIVLQAARTTPFCAVVAESSFASFRQFAYIRVGQMFHTGSWFGKTVLRPAVELALVYGKLTRGVDLSQASPQDSVAGSPVPTLADPWLG
jgi:uncharacterized protein